jgi:hypothetical protein
MLLEELIAAELAGHGSGRCKPIAMFVDDGETVDAIDRGSARLEKVSKFRNGRRTGAVHLEAGNDANDAGVQEVKAVLGVLGERTRKVRHLGSGIAQPRFPRTPFAPAAHSENGCTYQRDENRSQGWQAAQAGFMTDGIHRTGILRNDETSHERLILP